LFGVLWAGVKIDSHVSLVISAIVVSPLVQLGGVLVYLDQEARQRVELEFELEHRRGARFR
jgi:hypothetical protein